MGCGGPFCGSNSVVVFDPQKLPGRATHHEHQWVWAVRATPGPAGPYGAVQGRTGWEQGIVRAGRGYKAYAKLRPFVGFVRVLYGYGLYGLGPS